MTGSAFDLALLEHTTLLEYDTGQRSELRVERWLRDPDPVDALLVDRCRGATLDIGCGPGRFTSALTRRGISAVGIDTSATAVRMTRQRGGTAVLGDVFDPALREGHWAHVLLADGNVGIGGDPGRLLRLVRALLAPGGSALVEVAPPGTGLHRGHARLAPGPWFPWAEIDADSLVRLGRCTQLDVLWADNQQNRWFVELGRPALPGREEFLPC